jgi:hypothetical protein
VPRYDEWRQRGRVPTWVYWVVMLALVGAIIGLSVTQ